MRFVGVEIGTRTFQLADGDEGLDSVRPDLNGRVIDPAGKQPSWEVTQVIGGGLDVAELQLETAQNAERQDGKDLVRHVVRERHDLLDRGACLLDEAEIRFEQRLRPPHPVTRVRVLRLLCQLVGRAGVLEGDAPTAGHPFHQRERPERHHSGDLVSS